MRLTDHELRARAAAFARDWAEARDENAESQSFWNAFFQIFDVNRRRVASFEKSVARLGAPARGRIDLFWPGELLVEQKSRGRDLLGAEQQALDYLHGLTDAEMPKRILTCDFRAFRLTDLDTRETVHFLLDQLPDKLHLFDFVLGRQRPVYRAQDPVNIRAAELVGKLHDLLRASRYDGHDLEVFLTRIVFLMFADDTGIIEPRDTLLAWLEDETRPDGTDMGARLHDLFQVLNTPEDRRQTTLPADLAQFPYVNGALFAERIAMPAFDEQMRAALLNACRFDWTPISPAIFGSLFQSVMDPRARRETGAHYTTEKNILKVLGPLVLDDLHAELARAKTERALRALHDRLARMTFFDPACGCGNFLVIAYREIRRIETEILRRLYGTQQALMPERLSLVDVDQFHGIEIGEFPAEIARTALWMMDHLMNRELSAAFGRPFVRIPLRKAPHILHADALETDWASFLPPERCSYLLGNPPFVGAKFQKPAEREQVRRIAALGKSGGTLDLVAAWFIKAGEYVQGSTRIAFVATNSITQGEQVAQLWPILFDRCGLEIAFAHRTFAWGSEARGKAHVHVVILGLDRRAHAPAERRLFSYPDLNGDPVETTHKALSPYLFDAGGLVNPHLVVREESRPVNGMPRLLSGSQPIDGGHLILSSAERQLLLSLEPDAEPFIRPFIGAEEFLHGGERWIIALQSASPHEVRRLPQVKERLRRVREFRSTSNRESTLAIANAPMQFNVTVLPVKPFLVVPEVSSERREYMPIGWAEPPTIPSNKVRILIEASLTDFAFLTSAMHMAWLRYIGGRLKSDFQYGIGVVYNTFPLPPELTLASSEVARLATLAQGVLDARAAHPGSTLADLYDPDLMPADLRRAHQALDRAVDRLYRPQGFGTERERVEHLFALYERMTAPLLAAPRKGARPRRPPP